MGAHISTPDTDTRSVVELGSWLSRTKDTIYQAATDGFVIATQTVGEAGQAYLETDSATPPTVKRAMGLLGAGLTFFICSLVKKDDYWNVIVVSGAASLQIFWIPFTTTIVNIRP